MSVLMFFGRLFVVSGVLMVRVVLVLLAGFSLQGQGNESFAVGDPVEFRRDGSWRSCTVIAITPRLKLNCEGSPSTVTLAPTDLSTVRRPLSKTEQAAECETLLWPEALKKNDLASYRDYVNKCPEGQAVAEAKMKYETLLYAAATRHYEYEEFIRDHPRAFMLGMRGQS